MEVKVVIPSHKRASSITTHKVIANSIICVSEAQVDEYKRYNPDANYVTHPDDVIGVGKKRQWIYDHFGDVFMADDDVIAMKTLYESSGNRSLDPQEAYEVIQQTANVAKEMGAKHWGFSHHRNPLHYQPFTPFSLDGFLPGWSLGLFKDDKLEFVTDVVVAEDKYIYLLNKYYNRFNFVNKMVTLITKESMKESGGLTEMRTDDNEFESFLFLYEKFGKAVYDKFPGFKEQYQERLAYERNS